MAVGGGRNRPSEYVDLSIRRNHISLVQEKSMKKMYGSSETDHIFTLIGIFIAITCIIVTFN